MNELNQRNTVFVENTDVRSRSAAALHVDIQTFVLQLMARLPFSWFIYSGMNTTKYTTQPRWMCMWGNVQQ